MMEGTVITFYSYKGGVGRTMALANVATLLASWGYRVLCVDWDLEAPGLHLYFKAGLPSGGRSESSGLVDLVDAHVREEKPDWKDYLTPVRMESSGVELDLLHAGRHDATYVERMQALDWEELYSRHSFGEFLEEFRAAALERYDFVLVDSRTGVTDIGGICTVQLPDFLVMLFTANEQSFYGALEVLELVERQRDRIPFDRARLATLPVITLLESRFEYELAQQWLKRFEEGLGDVLKGWLPAEVTPRDILLHLRVPYFPYWSFGERLAVLETGTRDPDDIGYSFETLAALLAQQLAGTQLLVQGRREALVSAARQSTNGLEATGTLHTEFATPPLDVFVSYSHKDERFRDLLSRHLAPLTREGLVRTWHDREIGGGEDWRHQIAAALEGADLIFLLVSSDYLASDYIWDLEMRRALERHVSGNARVVPIIVRPCVWEPTPIGELRPLPRAGKPVTTWSNKDEAWTFITQEIWQIVRQVQEERQRRPRPQSPAPSG